MFNIRATQMEAFSIPIVLQLLLHKKDLIFNISKSETTILPVSGKKLFSVLPDNLRPKLSYVKRF